VLLESRQSEIMAKVLAYELAGLPNLRPTEEAASPVQRIEHLDAEIHSVSLDGLAVDRAHRALASQVFAWLEPSFFALDRWVVVSTCPAAARQIIDADRGWTPRLHSVRGVGLRAQRHPENRVTLAAAQPALASAVVYGWQQDDQDSPLGGLDQVVGGLQLSVGSVYRPTLGVAIKEGDRAGSVVVVEVHPDTPAAGRLEPDDEIIGVDGKLLALDDPMADLRRRLAGSQDPEHLSIRVRRGRQLRDVGIPLPPRPAPSAHDSTPPDPLRALRQLQSLARLTNTASYIVFRTPSGQFHARLSLQLVPNQQAGSAPQPGDGAVP
jgi:hypothetical protein